MLTLMGSQSYFQDKRSQQTAHGKKRRNRSLISGSSLQVQIWTPFFEKCGKVHMPPFWASQKQDESRGAAVLLDEYAADPEPQRSSTSSSKKRPLFPAGAPKLPKRDPENRNTLPAAVVKTDPRREREFSNRRDLNPLLGAWAPT
eukprot:symbB.v1.2.035316.t1/scaffold4726.1/size35721/1